MRKLNLNKTKAKLGTKATTSVKLVPEGDEYAVQFTLEFNPAVVNYYKALLPKNSQATITVNDLKASEGIIAILLDAASPLATTIKSTDIVKIKFGTVGKGESDIKVTSSLIQTVASDGFGNTLYFDHIKNGKIFVM